MNVTRRGKSEFFAPPLIVAGAVYEAVSKLNECKKFTLPF